MLRGLILSVQTACRLFPTAIVIAVIAVWPSESRSAEPQERTGAQLFRSLCASCHGPTAHGDGPVGVTLIKPPADLTKIARRNGGHFPATIVHRKIDGREEFAAHGPRAMPIWGRALYFSANPDDVAARARTDAEVDRIVEFLRSLQER